MASVGVSLGQSKVVERYYEEANCEENAIS